MLDESTKQVAYLLHDIYGNHAEEVENAQEFLRLAADRGWTFVLIEDLKDAYRDGQLDAVNQGLTHEDW